MLAQKKVSNPAFTLLSWSDKNLRLRAEIFGIMGGVHSLPQTLTRFFTEHKRNLPWRKTHDPYKILVSEVMLQQTQVERVLPKYKVFLQAFPNVRALAESMLPEVLGLWSGLGYNRRAKFLRAAAKEIVEKHRGTFPKTAAELEQLSGVGPYTARAVAAFAYNSPEVFIETNIRTVFTDFYFKNKDDISDKDILPLIARDLMKSKMAPRDFYAALMDYGSHLKKSGVRINKQSKHYNKQSTFKGSSRELRGAVMRELLKSPAVLAVLQKKVVRPQKELERILLQLQKENLVAKRGRVFRVAQ